MEFSLISRFLPTFCRILYKKMGREPGQFDHVRDDVLCVVLCVVLVIELLPTHVVMERISVLETVRVALLTFTALGAAQDDRKEAQRGHNEQL